MSATPAMSTNATTLVVMTSFLRSPRRLTRGLLAQVSIQEIFRELHTFEFQDAGVLVNEAVEWQPNRPGTREHGRILERRLVDEHVRSFRRIALHHMQRRAGEVAAPIEPRLAVEPRGIYDEGVFLPTTLRGP